jgi:hypothetical protein
MEFKKTIERLHIDALLKRLARLGEPMPAAIEEAERPDFILHYGPERVGLESTRSVYQELVRADILQAARCPREWILTGNLMDGPRRRSDDEILGEMLSFSEEMAWKSCEQEMRDWRDKIARSLAAKRERLNQPRFRRLDRNWLLIYDQPGLGNDQFTHEAARRHLAQLFSSPPGHPIDYDAVFVLSRRYLFRWQKNRLWLHYDRTEA